MNGSVGMYSILNKQFVQYLNFISAQFVQTKLVPFGCIRYSHSQHVLLFAQPVDICSHSAFIRVHLDTGQVSCGHVMSKKLLNFSFSLFQLIIHPVLLPHWQWHFIYNEDTHPHSTIFPSLCLWFHCLSFEMPGQRERQEPLSHKSFIAAISVSWFLITPVSLRLLSASGVTEVSTGSLLGHPVWQLHKFVLK